VTSLMRYFEEMALMQSEAMGVGFGYYREHGVIWMLHQFDIRLHRLPAYGETVLVRTVPTSVYRFMGFRQYLVFGQTGEELITAGSSWLHVNTVSKRPVRVGDDMKRAYGHWGEPEARPGMEDVPPLVHADHATEFRVRQSDIDVNRHVNNVQYVEWALEALPQKVTEGFRLGRLQVAFRKETLYGESIQTLAQVQSHEGGLVVVHAIRVADGQDKCTLRSEWVSE